MKTPIEILKNNYPEEKKRQIAFEIVTWDWIEESMKEYAAQFYENHVCKNTRETLLNKARNIKEVLYGDSEDTATAIADIHEIMIVIDALRPEGEDALIRCDDVEHKLKI